MSRTLSIFMLKVWIAFAAIHVSLDLLFLSYGLNAERKELPGGLDNPFFYFYGWRIAHSSFDGTITIDSRFIDEKAFWSQAFKV